MFVIPLEDCIHGVEKLGWRKSSCLDEGVEIGTICSGGRGGSLSQDIN